MDNKGEKIYAELKRKIALKKLWDEREHLLYELRRAPESTHSFMSINSDADVAFKEQMILRDVAENWSKILKLTYSGEKRIFGSGSAP